MATKPDEVNPFAQYVEQPKEAPNPFAQYAQNRTAGEALVTDPISSFLGGLGGALSSPTQVSRLITGEKPPAEAKGTTESLLDTLLPFGGKPSDIASTALEKLTPSAPSVQSVTDLALNPFAKFAPVGAELSSFADKHKSAGLKNSETELSNKINAANGFFNEAGVAVAGTLTNPALLSDFIFSQIPNMAGPLGGGAISKELVHAFFKDATVKTLDRAAVSGAVATAAAMQGGDIGSDTYKTINDRLIKEGMDPEKAHTIALEKARVAAAEAAAISVASSFIPGGQALEKRFLTQAGKESAKKGGTSLLSKITNVVGESSQEGVEEGGGKLASNVQVQQVFPETDIMKGVGAATGQGAIGGGLFGGISNIRGHGTPQTNVPPNVPPSATAPGVQPGVTPGTPPTAPVSPGLVTPEDLETHEAPAAKTETQKEKIARLMEVKPNNPTVEEEGLKIVGELKRLGQVPFAEGMEASIKGGGFETPAQLDFYRQKLEEAKSLAQEEGKEFHEEHSIDKYLSGNKADQKRFAAFLPQAPEQVQNIVAQSNEYLQKLTDQINAKGYKLLDVDSRAPQDVQELKAQISGIAGSTVSLVKNAEHIEKNNRFANPEKFEKIALTLSNDYKNANQLLGQVNEEEKPAQQEAVQAVENVPEAAQAPVEAEATSEEVQVQQEPSEPAQLTAEPVAEEETPAATPQTVLENLIANKDDVIQKIEKSYDITPERAAQVYEAEKEYREAVEKYGYAPNPDPDHEAKYMAAVNRHRQFFKRLNAAQKKKKTKAEVKPETPAQEHKAVAKIKNGLIRFASGMSGLSDLVSGSYWRAGHQNYGVGFDVGLLSKNAINQMAHYIVNMDTQVFIDSGAFSHFRKKLKGKEVAELDFDKILRKYEDILYAIGEESENQGEKVDYPRPMLVMPDIVGDQTASLDLINNHKDWIAAELYGNLSQPIIPLQKGDLTLSEAYDKVINTLKDNNRNLEFDANKIIFGIPSNAEAVSRDDLVEFLQTSKPARIHFLGAAADSKLNPLLKIVAENSPDTKVTADASKVRSAILNGVAKGKTRDEAIKNALYESEDPMVLMSSMGDSNVIDVIATDLTPQQSRLLENQVKNLSEKEIDTLEKHYGHHNKSSVFIKRLREDIINYINKGADAVDETIRKIIAKLQASVLAVAMVFNPAYMSQQSIVVYPAQVTTEQIKAAVPEQAKEMSDSGKKAFSTLFAALQPELQSKNKLFTVVDKPTSKVFVFNPDGSVLVKDNVVLGMAMGDTYVGGTDFKGNRITPAGLFNVSAEKGGATYDGKTIYTVGNTKEGWNTAFMHTVYLKEADAAARKKGLETGEGTRLSHGCVNASPEVMAKIGEDNRMDGSHVFVVPDNQTKIDDYIANNVPNEDLTRTTVEPVKKTTTTPEIKVERTQVAREEEAIEPRKTPAEINRERQAAKKNKAKAVQEMVQPNVEPVKKKTAKERVQEIHEEQISEYTKLRQRLSHLTRKVSEGKISLGIQREITDLLELTRDLKQDIKLTTPKNNTAEHFYKRALDEFTKGNITRDVLDVVKYFYDNNPEILNGIKLSVRQTDQEGHMGNFAPLQRLVTLYKEAGANSPETARHEIMHSLEQMMNSDTRQAIIDAWKDALEMAIKQYGQDQRASMYFNAVLDFINNPNEANFKRAVSIMPSKDLYQFINPSEFWAVNAEKLMAAKMGTPWAKFVKFMKMLGEGLKKLFGLENQYAVHKAFNELLSGNGKRMDKQSLTSYMHAGELDFEFLNDIKDIEDLMDKHNRPEVAVHTSRTVTDRLLGGYEEAKAIKAKIMENPKAPIIGMVGTLDRGLLNARVQTTNFIAGLEAADRAKYAGELEDGQKRAIASVAMTQALKAARIGTRVILMGKLAFDEVHQIFKAVEDKYSMANIMNLKHQLEKQLGSKLAAKTINSYLEAKRSKSINQEFADRSSQLERINALLEVPTLTETERADLIAEQVEAQEDVKQISIAMDKVNMDEEAIEEFIALEKDLPQLKEIMKNWNHVNKNMINMMEFSKIISAKRAETLRNIEDYVPWYRVQDDQEDVHQGTQSAKGVRNISREKRFKEGKVTEDINDIVDNMLHNVMVTTRNSIRNFAANRIAQEYAERNEKGKIRVYPAEDFDKGIVRIMVNGKKINVKISDPLIAQSVIGIESFQMPMNNMMAGISNFLRRSITLSGIFQVKQLFMDAPTAALVAGVKHPYKLYAGVFGSFLKALAPTALKPVDYVINKFTPFTTNLSKEDPIIELLKNHGIGGYHSMARTAEREFKQQIGLLSKSKMAQIANIFDKIGDASDIAQRRAVYNRVMAETNGDQRAAIMGANNIIDFDKRGANGFVNGLNRTVAFMNAYAQQIDVLTQALGEVPAGAVEKLTGAKITSVSGNLHGLNRNEAMTRLMWAGFLLTMTTLAYTSMVGDDDDYKKLDDQTRMRNFFIPRSLTKHIGMDKPLLIPMHTSAAFYYKSIPEMLFNKQIKEGTKDTIDKTRLHTALGKAFLDSMLGPLATGPIPSAFKPGVEIALNHSFYMGGNITPTGMKDLAAFDQIKGSTSELGKWLSAATQIPGTAKTNPDGTVKENSRSRMLNPLEADYVMRSLGGTMASIAMWGSNLFSGERPSPTEHDNILYGSFVAPDIPRGREDLFYDLQGRSNEAYKTYTDLMKNGRAKEGDQWFKDNQDLITANGYTEGVSKGLQSINAEIRRTEKVPSSQFTPEEKRQRIDYLKKTKEDMLQEVIQYRLKAGL